MFNEDQTATWFSSGDVAENKYIVSVKDFLILKGKINTKTFIIKADVLGHFNSNLKNAKWANHTESQLPYNSNLLALQELAAA